MSLCVCLCVLISGFQQYNTDFVSSNYVKTNPSPSNLCWLSVYWKIWIWTTSKECIFLPIYSPWSQTQFRFMGCFMYCACQDSSSVINEISRLDISRFHRRGPSGFTAVINSCKKGKTWIIERSDENCIAPFKCLTERMFILNKQQLWFTLSIFQMWLLPRMSLTRLIHFNYCLVLDVLGAQAPE